MTVAEITGLAGLALVDSTSFGTLGIPVFFLLQKRIRITTLAVYLATICGFYWCIGIALTLGADRLTAALAGAGDHPYVVRAQLVLGVALFALSFRFDRKRAARRRTERATSGAGPTRRDRFKTALLGERPRTFVVAGAALGAGLVEVASMLPFLGAIGTLTRADIGPATTAVVLVGYVAVMAVPALALLGARIVAAGMVEPALARLGAWLERNADELLGWVVGIVGFLLASDAASRLALLG